MEKKLENITPDFEMQIQLKATLNLDSGELFKVMIHSCINDVIEIKLLAPGQNMFQYKSSSYTYT